MNRLRTLFALNASTVSDADRRFAVQARLYGMGYRYNPDKTQQYLEEHGPAAPQNHTMVYMKPKQADGRQDVAMVITQKRPDTFCLIEPDSKIVFFNQPAGYPFSNFYPDVRDIQNWRDISVNKFLSTTETDLIKSYVKTTLRNLAFPYI